jgi:hypothetical protein
MALRDILKKPLLKKANTCERCGRDFACEIALTGCWCTEVKLSDEALEYMRSSYKSCLCRECLESIQAEPTPK